MKLIITIFTVLLLCIPNLIYASDLKTLEDYAFTSKDNKFIQLRHKTMMGDLVFMRCEENLVSHSDFRWHWKVHALSFLKNNNNTKVTVYIREYQEFNSPDSRGFIEWILIDINFDNKVESYIKNYMLVMQDKVIMIPDWPSGLINDDWYIMSQKEMNEMFKNEINYWMKKIGK